jgi:hypothetical protein
LFSFVAGNIGLGWGRFTAQAGNIKAGGREEERVKKFQVSSFKSQD